MLPIAGRTEAGRIAEMAQEKMSAAFPRDVRQQPPPDTVVTTINHIPISFPSIPPTVSPSSASSTVFRFEPFHLLRELAHGCFTRLTPSHALAQSAA